MRIATRISWTVASTLLALLLAAGTASAGQRPNTMEACKLCHAPAEGVVRGKLVSVAPALRSLSVTVGPLVWIVKYGDGLRVKQGEKVGGPEALKTIPRDREIAVSFEGGEARPVALQVSVKQPYVVPAGKLVPVERMRELVAPGPGAGRPFLFDSRPAPLFAEGHLPGASSLPYAAFKERAAAALPADKGAPLVFYCAGET